MSAAPRVLVVDDEPDIRLIVGLNLSLAGVEFGEADNGDTACAMLSSGSWDGCILDLAMPRADGFSVLRAVSADEALADLAIVVLSARGSPQAAMEALTLGAHAHLIKPFSPAAVAQAMQELITLDRNERELHRQKMLQRAATLERLGLPTV